MKIERSFSRLTRSLRGAGLALLMAAAPLSHASTVWTGPNTNYTQPASDPTLAADQDRLTSHVWLTRASTEGLFNAVNESSYDQATRLDPSDTEWAEGNLDNYASLSYTTWAAVGGGNPVNDLVGVQLVLHLITDDIYLSLMFTQLGGHGAGGFAYQRSTPAVSLPAPTVSITNPAAGAVFAAPANLRVAATAAVSIGTVTNVAFFATNATTTNSLGSALSSPFNITSSGLAAGNYSLIAVATAAGISATSSVVNVSVVSPVAVSNSVPAIAAGQFSLNYSANVGLTYVVQRSSDLSTWVPVVTNVASSNPVHFTETAVGSGARFYRVVRQPNP